MLKRKGILIVLLSVLSVALAGVYIYQWQQVEREPTEQKQNGTIEAPEETRIVEENNTLDAEMIISAEGAIDLIVTDPDGFTITPDAIIPSDLEFIRAIPGVLYYSEMERGRDGNPIV